MRVGTQFNGTLAPRQTRRWFTFNWPQQWHVTWYMMPTTRQSGSPQLHWDVAVERASTDRVTYWITVTNDTGSNLTFEGRYAVLN